MAAILDGIRVLDLARYVAGPMAAAMLGDLGADVIRIEPPGGAEDRMPLPIGNGLPGGAGFIQTGRNKRSLGIDLETSAGRAVFDRLVATADVVIVNAPPAAITGLGLDYPRLSAIRPDLVFLHLTAFGSDGPYADRLGFDAIAQVMSGLPWLSGDAGHPMKSAAAWVDMASGFLGAFGVMAALRHRDATGEGQQVEANLLRTALTVGNYFLIEQAVLGLDRGGTGNRAPSGAPADLVRTRDGWIYIAVLGNTMFRRFARLIGREEFIADPRFGSDEARAGHGAVLSDLAGQWASAHTTADALAVLERHRIPSGPLLTPRQVLADPHCAAQCLSPLAIDGAFAPIPYVVPPVTFAATPGVIARGPPHPGEHTAAVLAELGYLAADIAALQRDGVIGSDRPVATKNE